MPRVAPTLYDFVELDNGDYLKVSEAVFRIFDRQEWLRVNRARARIKVLIDKIGIDAFREMVEEELEGDWVAERDFSIDHLLSTSTTRRPTRRRRPPQRREPERRPLASSTASREANVRPQRQEGFSTVEVKVTRGDLTPEQFRGLAADHARVHRRLRAHDRAPELRPALGPRRGALRRLARGSASSASATPAPSEITDVVSCPGTDSCKLGITASMGLNKAIQERIESMEITDPLTKQRPHQDVRLPERLQPAPHREHRLLRRLAEGRRPHDPRLHPAPRRQLRGRRGRLRPPPQGAPARQARARRGRALAAALRGRARRTARSSTTSSSASAPAASRPRSRTSRCRPSSASRPSTSSSTGTAPSPTRSSAARASARYEQRRPVASAPRPLPPTPSLRRTATGNGNGAAADDRRPARRPGRDRGRGRGDGRRGGDRLGDRDASTRSCGSPSRSRRRAR